MRMKEFLLLLALTVLILISFSIVDGKESGLSKAVFFVQ
jgi:hypothetical protein